MYKALIVCLFIGISTEVYSQETTITSPITEIDLKTKNKGKFYFYWGWNKSQYSYSDLTFKGDDYNFTLYNVAAKDRQTQWDADVYMNPTNISIPQTVGRIGYYFHDHWNISIGVDHMKYVMVSQQFATIDGYIDLKTPDSEFNGVYDNAPIYIDEDFLEFEHTDGLNYVNVELSRVDNLGDHLKWNSKKIQLNVLESVGVGVLYPKTNTTLMSKERYDAYHLSGFGLSLKGGVNLTLFNHFFVQAELKAGYFTMPNIRTTTSSADSASQDFFFFQRNISFGYIFQLIN
ncbi:MAG: hypothetical protein P8O96_05420 [Flavobacteriaceae bacterium]|jgi:hypothetical protein|nr:hypothetical protein [Flavobacteriaceae bacterium]MDG1794108.1 hypothetical protein [Flavobacteriaceae bacterium]